ncbi:MAG TPA: polysaccharide deacetylase family protein, partial [Trebonia sp.]
MSAAMLRVPVLMYHEIADRTVTDDPLAVAPKVFADQLGYLRDAGFTPVTAAALTSTLVDGGDLPERPVAVTFDDGHEDFHTDALPLLNQHGFTGTLFMTTDWVGFVGYGKRMMTWTQLAEAVAAGAEISAHTRSHPQL